MKRTIMSDPNPYSTANGSSNKRSKPPPPPLNVPHGHVAFRLLCHASRIGGVIGKSGNVIKQLQNSTGVKIRIEEAPADSPDRVVTVIGPTNVDTRMSLNSSRSSGSFVNSNGNEGNGEDRGDKDGNCFEVSKAQEGLIRVFERILEVAAENDGIEIGVVSCRLLAETHQVGSIIGKGGKVVEKIRKESGCKIRVLTENLSACAGPNDEIVEIDGDVLAVKKALIAVSRRLQDCPSVDKTRMIGSKSHEAVPLESMHRPLEVVSQETMRRPIEAIPHDIIRRPLEAVPQENLRRPLEAFAPETSRRSFETVPLETLRRPFEALPQESLPDLHVDLLSQRNSLLSTIPSSSISYASGVHPVSLEADRISTLDTKMQQQEVSFRILCSNDKVGGVIGKGGSIVKALQNETGASISVGSTVADCDERLITVSASENPESRYSPAQKAVVLVFSRLIEAGFEKGPDLSANKGFPVIARLVVASIQVGCLLGKGGIIISEMRKATGTGIRIIGEQVPKCTSDNDKVVQISGEFAKVKDAVYNVTGRLRDNLFSSSLNNAGIRSTNSVLADTSPYGRLREPASFGLPSSVGVSHSVSRHPTLTQSMDHIGFSCSLDCPPSPRLWASQAVSGVHPWAITDVSRGRVHLKGGLELGSGNKTAIVTNTTVEIIVPENVIGSVYGENGSNLARLKQISGAKVIVHEPRLGSTDRIIVISGTPDETQAAQSLLQAFILTGPS
ncbi:KH domain-containing protein HEN4 isoform X2 [Pistacia vera]|uniref:KH domain-containing protein HEN4 isoform X2 n=1 Tax=Pistacia vera TaxID=55513 RepID=UPI0012635176|nr:KH domain-containing protein HEN4 isoform X2 [Pistacia vera]